MKTVATIIIVLTMMSCGHRGENQFDTNAAEMNETPGDKDRRNSETNGEAERRAGTRGGGTLKKDAPEKVTGDALFAAEATEAGLAEVTFGKLAATKTKNEKLTEFAEMMVKDHSAANAELTQLADRKGISIPTECRSCDVTFRELRDVVGKEFEKKYATTMVSDHEKAVALFKRESEHGKDPEIKAWAAEKLPTLQHHLEMAKELEEKSGL